MLLVSVNFSMKRPTKNKGVINISKNVTKQVKQKFYTRNKKWITLKRQSNAGYNLEIVES